MSRWLVPWESGPLPALRSREAGSLGPTGPPSPSGGPSQKHNVAVSPPPLRACCGALQAWEAAGVQKTKLAGKIPILCLLSAWLSCKVRDIVGIRSRELGRSRKNENHLKGETQACGVGGGQSQGAVSDPHSLLSFRFPPLP